MNAESRPAPLAALPFRLCRNGGLPYLQGDARVGNQVLTATFFAGTVEFLTVTALMEAYRALERSVGGIEGERDAAKEQVAKLRDELHRRDCKIAEYERRLTRNKREA